jgi:hypothetical protein
VKCTHPKSQQPAGFMITHIPCKRICSPTKKLFFEKISQCWHPLLFCGNKGSFFFNLMLKLYLIKKLHLTSITANEFIVVVLPSK